MSLKSKYGWSHEDMIRYIYNELENEQTSSLIYESIEKSDKDILEILSDIRMTKSFRGFKNSDEHIKTIKEESAAHTAKLAKKYGLELLSSNQKNTISQPKISKPYTRYIIIVIAIVIITVIVLIFFPKNQTKGELPVFAETEITTSELPQLPSKYETVLSSDNAPKEISKSYYAKDFKRTISLLKTELDKTENDANKQELELYIGICYLRLGKSKQAIRYIKPVAASQSAYNNDAKLELIYAYLKFGENQEALDIALGLKNDANVPNLYKQKADKIITKILEVEPNLSQN